MILKVSVSGWYSNVPDSIQSLATVIKIKKRISTTTVHRSRVDPRKE
jgi:hypothetical protein